MANLPREWRIHDGRRPARRNDQRIHRAAGRRGSFSVWLLHEVRDAWPLLATAAILLTLLLWRLAASPWEPSVTLRHMLAAPNCAAARTMGLAPSHRGQPGYYLSHDADRDGVACEPYRQ